MEKLVQDLKYALRVLTKSPGFAVVAVLSLALGVGVNTAIFSVFSAIILQPPPVADPGRVVQMYTSDRQNPGNLNSSYPNFVSFRDQNEVFTGMAAFSMLPLALSSGGEVERLWGAMVTGDYFPVLGIKAMHGRLLQAEDDKVPGANAVAVISHGLWQRRFASDPGVIGQTITLNGHDFVVVGVGPAGFSGTDLGLSPEIWVPMTMYAQVLPGFNWMDKRLSLWLSMVGRLKKEVTLAQAQSSMDVLAVQLESAYPEANKERGISLVPIMESKLNLILRLTGGTKGNVKLILTLLMIVSGAVLLICCANVASVLLSRATARRREIGIRLALGATRGRLIRQLLTESILLALLGGTVGLLITLFTSSLIGALRPASPVPLGIVIAPDRTVLAFTLLISLLTGILLGLVPAITASKPNLVDELKGRIGPALGRGKLALRDLLVVVQVALSLILVVGAGLFLRSLQNAHSIDLGFKFDNLMVMSLDVRLIGYTPAQGKEYFQRLVNRVESTTGVAKVSLAESLPLEAAALRRNITVEGAELPPGEDRILIYSNVVGAGYFETMGIPLLQGREFTIHDKEDSQGVMIINEAMAKRFWPGKDAIGKRISISGPSGAFLQVVGIAKNTAVRNIGETAVPFFYIPSLQNYYPQAKLLVQTTGNPATLLGEVRSQVKSTDPRVPVFDVKTFAEHVGDSLWAARMGAGLLVIYGFVALVLAMIGVYGVVSYSVSQRTREIGIRMALGAQAGTVITGIVRKSLTVAAIGVGLGLGCAFFVTRVAANLLYSISPIDPVTYVGAAFILLLVALAASLFPARRVTRIDPLLTLKQQ